MHNSTDPRFLYSQHMFVPEINVLLKVVHYFDPIEIRRPLQLFLYIFRIL